jgi:hypothetical protein
MCITCIRNCFNGTEAPGTLFFNSGSFITPKVRDMDRIVADGKCYSVVIEKVGVDDENGRA